MAIDRVGNMLPNRSRIPKQWGDYMLANYYADNIVPQISNHDYVGKLETIGDTVIIQKRIAIESFTYKVGEGLKKQQTLADDSISLTIDYADYFNVPIADVDKFQSIGDYAAEIFDEGSRTLGTKVEKRVWGSIYSSAGNVVSNSDFSGTPGLDASNALKFFMLASTRLNEANIPEDQRWAVIDPYTAYFLGLSDLKAAYLTGESTTPLRTGMPFEANKPIAGFKVYISNNLSYSFSAGAGFSHIVCGHMDALTFASQINKVETLRDTDDFGDLLRSLIVYGFKVVQPKALVHVNITAFGTL